MTDPFRNELEAAHQRIAKLEGEHAARVAELEGENRKLRARLVEIAPSRTKTGRVFLALATIMIGISIIGGIVFARLTRAPAAGWAPAASQGPIELGPQASADAIGFDRDAVSRALDTVHLSDCVDASHKPGFGHVRLLLVSSGVVGSAMVDQGPYATTSEGRCIEDRYRAVLVPAWHGGPSRVVGKAFDVH